MSYTYTVLLTILQVLSAWQTSDSGKPPDVRPNGGWRSASDYPVSDFNIERRMSARSILSYESIRRARPTSEVGSDIGSVRIPPALRDGRIDSAIYQDMPDIPTVSDRYKIDPITPKLLVNTTKRPRHTAQPNGQVYESRGHSPPESRPNVALSIGVKLLILPSSTSTAGVIRSHYLGATIALA
ncbi:hypothetical protein BOTBODRAFT_46654 [Botryobasidium botryosum FD-172 SS1]|uniref:Uncharacterized protein n=1 Tax=Botryobasidium botryosum (strain FD-172 SS1) TaxID=930990 RepID=A0A067MGX5_BOTB1|nr:hypothetical protein BOTBODRAFT_46654 [Botryobasidium botryosum FD-172 SS1]